MVIVADAGPPVALPRASTSATGEARQAPRKLNARVEKDCRDIVSAIDLDYKHL